MLYTPSIKQRNLYLLYKYTHKNVVLFIGPEFWHWEYAEVYAYWNFLKSHTKVYCIDI